MTAIESSVSGDTSNTRKGWKSTLISEHLEMIEWLTARRQAMSALQAVDPNLETSRGDPDRHLGQTISPPGGAIPKAVSFSRPSV